MSVSVRSYLVAGTVATVAAGALALNPATSAPVQFTATPAQIQVDLAAAADPLSSILTPITAILASGGLAVDYLLNPVQEVPDFSGRPYPGAFPYTRQGVLGQILFDGFPVVGQLATNAVTTLQNLAVSQFNAVEDLLDGKIAEALQTSLAGLVAPLQQAVSRGAQVINALANGFGLITQSVVGVLGQVGKALEYTFEAAGKALSDGDLLGAYAALATGFLGNRFANPADPTDPQGPYAIPGALIRGTIGTVVFDPAEPQASYDLVVPSVRTAVSRVLGNVAWALAGNVPNPNWPGQPTNVGGGLDPAAAVPAPASAATTAAVEASAAVETTDADPATPSVRARAAAPASGAAVRPARRAATPAAAVAEGDSATKSAAATKAAPRAGATRAAR